MSWLFNSRCDDDDDPQPSSTNTHRGVKEDLTSFFRGVAAFLSPPPSPPSPHSVDDERRLSSDSPTQLALLGIRNDLAEIRGNLTNFASSLFNFPSSRKSVFKDEGFDQVPGISEQIVDFAIKIATRPVCWTDFPLPLNTEFELSEAQRAHASAIGHLVPALVAVKNEVSSYMDDEHFWLIYFILLMPRLNGHDFELLANCKVFETRDQLLRKLQKKDTGSSNVSDGHETPEEGSGSRETETMERAMERAMERIETLRIEEREISDESSEERQRSFRDEEVMSFSDLDIEDVTEKPLVNRRRLKRPASNASGSSWVQLSRSQVGQSKTSEGDSSDWLPIGDSD